MEVPSPSAAYTPLPAQDLDLEDSETKDPETLASEYNEDNQIVPPAQSLSNVCNSEKFYSLSHILSGTLRDSTARKIQAFVPQISADDNPSSSQCLSVLIPQRLKAIPISTQSQLPRVLWLHPILCVLV